MATETRLDNRPGATGLSTIIVYCLVPDRPHVAPQSDKHASYAFMILGAFYEKKDAYEHIKSLKSSGFKAFDPRLCKVGIFMPTYQILNPKPQQRLIPDRRIAPMLKETCNVAESMAIDGGSGDGDMDEKAQRVPTRESITNVCFIDEKGQDPLQYRTKAALPEQKVALISFVTRDCHEYRTRQSCGTTSLAILGVFPSQDAANSHIAALEAAGHGDVAIWSMGLETWELLPPISDPQKNRQCLRHILRVGIHDFNQKNQGVADRSKKYEEPGNVKTILAQREAQKKTMEELQKLKDSGYKIPVSVGASRILTEEEFEKLKIDQGSAVFETNL